MPCCASAAQVTPAEKAHLLTAQQWNEDIRFLIGRLQAMHPAPFDRVGRARFDAAVSELHTELPHMSPEESVTGVMRLVALVGEGHTAVPVEGLRRFGYHVLPLRFYAYRDGLYLQAADRAYLGGLGGKLISIGGVPVADVVAKVRPLVPHDNDMTIESRLPAYLVIPEVLVGLGVLHGSVTSVPIELEKGLKKVRMDVVPVMSPRLEDTHDDDFRYTTDWVDSRATPPAFTQAHLDKPYWFEFQADTKTMFVQYNRPTSDQKEPMPAFAERLKAAIATNAPERMVLDLRENEGGEAYWNKYVFLAMIKAIAVDVPGKLFVLIGRQTFSAGSLLAIDLERYSTGIFIGEPTGGALHNFGNHDHIELPNSHLGVMIATRYYQNTPFGTETTWIAPAISVDPTQADYEAGRDTTYEATIRYVAPAQSLSEKVKAVRPDDVAKAFAAFRADPVNRYANWEGLLNTLGYGLIREKDFERAVAVMIAATLVSPQSANAFDSLGDAYRAANRKAEAIESYKKALKIDPSLSGPRKSLDSLANLATPSGTHSEK